MGRIDITIHTNYTDDLENLIDYLEDACLYSLHGDTDEDLLIIPQPYASRVLSTLSELNRKANQ